MMTKLNMALEAAMEEEYGWLPDPKSLKGHHTFSREFEDAMEPVFRKAEFIYVSIGRHRLRRALAAALIAAMILAVTAGAAAVQYVIVHWNEAQNEEQGTLDVTFDIDDPNGTAGEFVFKKPVTPDGYVITKEEKSTSHWYIEYKNEDGSLILYYQSKGVENLSVSYDNENADFQETTVNGHKGYQYSRLGNNALMWVDETASYDIGGTCGMDIIWKMAESVK